MGGDLREGKVTLPLIYALETRHARRARDWSRPFCATRNYDQVPFSKILEMLERHGGIERVKERAQAFTDKARAISEFPESPYQRALLAVTDLVTERDH